MLLLDRQDVVELLPMTECMAAVERAFAAHATGQLPAAPGVLGTQVEDGGFHVKTAAIGIKPGYYAAKINANYPGNPERHGLPAIQGLIALFDTATGRLLALLDSIEITTLRTAAGKRHRGPPPRTHRCKDLADLRMRNAGSRASSRAVARPARRPRPPHTTATRCSSGNFVEEMSAECGIGIEVAANLAESFPHCDMAVTCTPAREALVSAGDVRPGLYIAAVGADSEGKQELDPRVLCKARVVADIAEQSAAWARCSMRSRRIS